MKILNKFIALFFGFAFVSEFLFVYSHYNNFFLQNGIDVVKLSQLFIVIQIAKIIFDIPIGIAADLYNRRIILIIGVVAKALFCLICVISKSYSMFVFAAVLWGVGMSAIYYHVEVYIYDSLRHIRKEDKFASVISKYYAIQNISIALSSFVSIWVIRHFNFEGIFTFSAMFCVLALIVVLFMPHYQVEKNMRRGEIAQRIGRIASNIFNMTSRPMALRLITTSVLLDTLFIIGLDINTTLMSIAKTNAEKIAMMVGVVGFVRIFTNYLSGYTVKYFTFIRAHLFIFVTGFVLAFFSFRHSENTYLVISLYLCLYPFFDTSIKTRVQNKIQEESRATMMSVASIMVSLNVVVFNLIIGGVATEYDYYLGLFVVCMTSIMISELIRNTPKAYKTYRFMKNVLYFFYSRLNFKSKS
jgi:predicted MFS family arabinose efflux permease